MAMLFLYKCFSPYMWVFDSCLVIFLCGVKVGVQLHSFGCEYLVVPAAKVGSVGCVGFLVEGTNA